MKSKVDHEAGLEVKDFMDDFLNYVYVMPGRVTAARRRYDGSKGVTGKESEPKS